MVEEEISHIEELSEENRQLVIDMLGYRKYLGEYPKERHLKLMGYDTLTLEHRTRGGRHQPLQEECEKCGKKLWKADGICKAFHTRLGTATSKYYCDTCGEKTKMMKALDNFSDMGMR